MVVSGSVGQGQRHLGPHDRHRMVGLARLIGVSEQRAATLYIHE